MKNLVIDKNIFEELTIVLGKSFDNYLDKFDVLLIKTVKDINRYYKNKQFTEIIAASHTLKSTAGQIGALTLENFLCQIEDTCKNQKYESIPDLINSFKKEAKKVNKFLVNAKESA